MSLEDRADALEDSAGDCGASVGLDLLAYGIGVCGVDSPYHHTVRWMPSAKWWGMGTVPAGRGQLHAWNSG